MKSLNEQQLRAVTGGSLVSQENTASQSAYASASGYTFWEGDVYVKADGKENVANATIPVGSAAYATNNLSQKNSIRVKVDF